MLVNQAPQAEDFIVGNGKIYFDRFDENGLATGEVHLGNCTELVFSQDIQKIEKHSRMDKDRRLLKSVVTDKSASVRIAGDEFNPFNVALATMGQERDIAQAGQAITGEQLTDDGTVRLGRQYALTEELISAVTVTQGVTGLVLGTDYELDTLRGLVRFLPTSPTLDETAVIAVDYTSGVTTLATVAGGTEGKIEGRIRFLGDPTSGPIWDIVIWLVSISPEGDLGFITDEFGNWTLSADVLSDSANHPLEPLYRKTHRGNA